MDSPALFIGLVAACICYVVARIICIDMRTPRDTFEDDLQRLIRKHDEEINKRRRPVRENRMGKLHWWEFAGIAIVVLIALPLTFGYDGLAELLLLLSPLSIVAVGIGVFIWAMLKRDVVSWAFLARMHRNGALYLVVPFSFILFMRLFVGVGHPFSLPVLGPFLLPVLGWPVIVRLGFAELAVFYLSIPLLFAVLNPSGILRGLAAASLGFAFASVGISPFAGERYVFGQPELWSGLPLDPVIAGLLLVPAGAALVQAGYRGRWSIPVRVTRNRRAFVLAVGTALVVWALWGIFSGEDVWIAVAVALAFTCTGLLMQRYQWPRLPLLFGVILGSLIERNFLDAIAVHDLSGALARPSLIVLAAMVLVLAVLSYRLRRSGASSGDTRPPRFRLAALLQWRNVAPVLGAAVGAAFGWGSLGFEHVYGWFLPRVAGLAVMAFCLLELLSSTRDKEQRSNASPADDARETLAV